MWSLPLLGIDQSLCYPWRSPNTLATRRQGVLRATTNLSIRLPLLSAGNEVGSDAGIQEPVAFCYTDIPFV